MTNNEIVVRALANTGITALNEMQQAVLDAGTTKVIFSVYFISNVSYLGAKLNFYF